MNNQLYDRITERVIALLEAGTIPWHKPWKDGQPPQNLLSRKPYRGINVFLLNASKFASPYWLSFKQVETAGGTVRKGEHACPVVFWKLRNVEKDESDDQKRVPLLRHYNVFNLEQCENVKSSLIPVHSRSQFAPLEQCEKMVDEMPKRPEIVTGGPRASYSPSQDKVFMPDRWMFDSAEAYYNTLFHEVIHATGHSSRLARKEVIEPSRFASELYSREELVAEMGAAFLGGYGAIDGKTIPASAAYIQEWLTRLRDDRRLVIHAAAQAQKACDFVRKVEFNSEQVEGGVSP